MQIRHPFRVARQFPAFSRRFWIAIFHDSIEEGWMTFTRLQSIDYELAISVNVLTRSADETYADYISRVACFGSPDELAVKRADILDNYRRCPESLRKRYARALMAIDGGRPTSPSA